MSGIFFTPCLIVLGKARSLSNSTLYIRVEFSLVGNYWARVEVTDCDKPSSLPRCVVNYRCKKVSSTGPRGSWLTGNSAPRTFALNDTLSFATFPLVGRTRHDAIKILH